MNKLKSLTLIILVLIVASCGNNPNLDQNLFGIKIQNIKKSYIPSESIQFSVINKKSSPVDSVAYYLDTSRISEATSIAEVSVPLQNQKLGVRTLIAKIYSNGSVYEAKKRVTILSSIKPVLYTYTILDTYPHDIEAYTQGLEFSNDTLYESTGQYGESTLRKTNYITGEVLKSVPLSESHFGEGLTILNNKIYQLTWKAGTGFIYDLDTMEKTGFFEYGNSKQGWGLCNDKSVVYKSDGTERIWTLNTSTMTEEGYIEIYTNTRKIRSVNELEWVDGKIYANIYEQDAIAIIDPASGAVEGVIDLANLKENVTQHEELNVLNGIAYNGEPGILYITGKNWDKLFKIQIVEK